MSLPKSSSLLDFYNLQNILIRITFNKNPSMLLRYKVEVTLNKYFLCLTLKKLVSMKRELKRIDQFVQELECKCLDEQEQVLLFVGKGPESALMSASNNCQCNGNNCQCDGGNNCQCNGNNCQCGGGNKDDESQQLNPFCLSA